MVRWMKDVYRSPRPPRLLRHSQHEHPLDFRSVASITWARHGVLRSGRHMDSHPLLSETAAPCWNPSGKPTEFLLFFPRPTPVATAGPICGVRATLLAGRPGVHPGPDPRPPIVEIGLNPLSSGGFRASLPERDPGPSHRHAPCTAHECG